MSTFRNYKAGGGNLLPLFLFLFVAWLWVPGCGDDALHTDSPDGDADGEDRDGEMDWETETLPDGDVDGDLDAESEEEKDPDEEAFEEAAGFYPNVSACLPPKRRLSAWMLDFPRMNANGFYRTADHSPDGTAVLQRHSSTTIVLIPPEKEPNAFLVQERLIDVENLSFSSSRISELRLGEWYHGYFHGLWRFSEADHFWHRDTDDFTLAPFIWMDSAGGLWYAEQYSKYGDSGLYFDGERVLTVYVAGDALDEERSLENFAAHAGPIHECDGRVYIIANFQRGNGTGVLRSRKEAVNELEVVHYGPEAIPDRPNVFIDSSFDPETCRFVATGYWNLLEGRVGDPLEITNEQQTVEADVPDYCLTAPELGVGAPYISWMDFETDTLYGAKDINITRPADCPKFYRRRAGENRFETVSPTGVPAGVEAHWYPRSMHGNGADSLFLAGDPFSYRWSPELDRWEPVWEQPGYLFEDLPQRAFATVRSLTLVERPDGSFRVHVAGPRLPVMRRTACQGWEEAFPDSLGTLEVFDDGRRLYAVGGYDHVKVLLDEDQLEIIPGPAAKWQQASAIHVTQSGALYVVAASAKDPDRRQLWYLPERGADASAWTEITGFQPYVYGTTTYTMQPYFVVGAKEGVFVQAFPYSEFGTRRKGHHRIYRVERTQMEMILEVDTNGYLRRHGGEVFYLAKERIDRLDPESGEMTRIFDRPTSLPAGISTFYPSDFIRRADGTWVFYFGAQLAEYDPASDTYAIYGLPGNTRNLVRPEDFDADAPEYEQSTMFLKELPTGEILAAGFQGQVAVRMTDAAFFSE